MTYRLPRSILPASYTLEICPDLEANTFDGVVTTSASVIEATAELRCNIADLELGEIRIDGESKSFEIDDETEQLIVDLGGSREPGPLSMEASFSGVLNDDLRGFYRSTFTDDAGVEQTIATTQCQSTDARRIFPCWDEPDMKATFDITLVVDPALTVVSNGAEVSRENRADGTVAVRFAETMKMSTYLVAFVVGPLEISEPSFAGDVPVRIVHRPGQGHLTSFALEVAVAALNYFEDYYGIPYPTEKLDMIALPDFAMGAMENLGCVTYREILLLVDPETATQPELQNVADVVNHELAHMWFGDLVTMGWWNGIWLNEAFATFMEMKATDRFRPEWQRWTSFGISRSAAFDIDSLVATRAIEFPVISPADAEGMFDLLTYEKGAAVVRMLEQWLGEETFRDGIRHYLAKHEFGNTETHDLWDALEHIAGRPVTAAMETWIFQGGYPVIDVGDTQIHQRRFTYSGEGEPSTWSVPVQVRTRAGEVTVLEVDGESASLDIPADEIESFNHMGHGFYRVKLPPSRLTDLGSRGVDELEPVERFGLVDDAWSLTLAGETELSDFIALLDGYRSESDISVWQRIIGALGFIDHVADDDDRGALGERIADLISEARAKLGEDPVAGEPPRAAQLRGSFLGAAGTLTRDQSDVRLDAVARARQVLEQSSPDAELLSAAVKVVAANGTDDDFASFRRGFEEADNPQEEIRYLYALPLFPTAAQSDELITMALDGSIRSQNAPFVLAQALMHRDHGPAAWKRIQESWDDIHERFPSNTIVRMLTGVRWLTDPDTAEAVAAFFVDHPLPQGQKQLDQHLERLVVNARFRQSVSAALSGALS
ncbi:MAG: M1 family aminopeptidase [Acidimicrobiia bacterium]|nr:M1 family aminopeptidase [Acidimicrobiia bacterium]